MAAADCSSVSAVSLATDKIRSCMFLELVKSFPLEFVATQFPFLCSECLNLSNKINECQCQMSFSARKIRLIRSVTLVSKLVRLTVCARCH